MSGRITELKIRGYKGLTDLHMEGLGSFNMIIGANDVGKTSVLESIFLLSGYPNMKLPIRTYNWRNYEAHLFEGLTSLFHDFDIRNQAKIASVSSDSTRRNLVISAPNPSSVSETLVSQNASQNGDAAEIRTEEITGSQSSSNDFSAPRYLKYEATTESPNRNPRSFSGSLQVNEGNIELAQIPDLTSKELTSTELTPIRFFYPAYEYNTELIRNVITEKKDDELLKCLRFINPRIEGIAVNGDTVYLDTGLKKMMPLNMLGSGMIRTATILATCILGTERIVLIDEIENGLHYSVLASLLSLLLAFAANDRLQVFATTHRLGILKSLIEVLREDSFAEHQATTNCFALARDVKGEVRSYNYEFSQFEHCVTKGIEIR